MRIPKVLLNLFLILQIFLGNLVPVYAEDAKLNGEKGINSPKVIVSLASYPPKYDALPYALITLANQNVKPDEIILNLYEHENSEKDKQRIRDILKENNLEEVITVNWIEERIKSYAKLIPTLKSHPEDIIITADDDWEYHPDFVGDLLKKHRQFPNCIICNVASRLYDDYRKRTNNIDNVFPKNVPISHGVYCYTGFGMLCPPHCFNDKVFDQDLFMKEFPTTDDIWFSFCAKINETDVVRLFDYNWKNPGDRPAIEVIKKYKLRNIPELQQLNNGKVTDYNRKNLAKIKKMFEEMGIDAGIIKVNNSKNILRKNVITKRNRNKNKSSLSVKSAITKRDCIKINLVH